METTKIREIVEKYFKDSGFTESQFYNKEVAGMFKFAIQQATLDMYQMTKEEILKELKDEERSKRSHRDIYGRKRPRETAEETKERERVYAINSGRIIGTTEAIEIIKKL